MTITQAIRQARTRVAMVTWDTQYRVNRYNDGYRAWVEGLPHPYWMARSVYADTVVTEAIRLLCADRGLVDHDYVADADKLIPAATRSGYRHASIRERITRIAAQMPGDCPT